MIVHDLKTVFVHIPRAAGTSITHALLRCVLGRNSPRPAENFSKRLRQDFCLDVQQKHRLAAEYVPKNIRQAHWDAYYKFTFVRNPWTRAASDFCSRHLQPEYQHRSDRADRRVRARLRTEFNRYLLTCERKIQDVQNEAEDAYWTHAQTQVSYIINKSGKIILDDVFKLEELGSAITTIRISERTGCNIAIGKHNHTLADINYKELYTDETKDLVAEIYKDDIKMFGYTF